MSIVAYHADRYVLTYDTGTGDAITHYHESDRWSGCKPVPEDSYHACKLGISPGQHRLSHELVHHLLGHAYYRSDNGSPVIYRDAHALPQAQPDSDLEEWMVTALTYYVYGQPYDQGALMDLEQGGVDLAALARRACELIARAGAHRADSSKLIAGPQGRANSLPDFAPVPCPKSTFSMRQYGVRGSAADART